MPINNRTQIHITTIHRDICNVSTPHLIPSFNLQASQHIMIYFMLLYYAEWCVGMDKLQRCTLSKIAPYALLSNHRPLLFKMFCNTCDTIIRHLCIGFVNLCLILIGFVIFDTLKLIY